LRELPPIVRATPIEFLDALGTLYSKAGASSTAVAIALERFRRHVLRLCGLRGKQMTAADLATVLRRRFPQIDPDLEADLAACEEAAWAQTIAPREALKLIQKLHGHEERLRAAAKPGATPKDTHPNQQERAS
jgi:hypothetical protein